MRRRIHKTDVVFRHAYRTYEEAPSPNVWKKISSRLDEIKPEHTKQFQAGKKYLLLFGLFLPSLILRNPVVDPVNTSRVGRQPNNVHTLPVVARENKIPVMQITSTKEAVSNVVLSNLPVEMHDAVHNLLPSDIPGTSPGLTQASSFTEHHKPGEHQANVFNVDLSARKLSPVFRPYWEATLFASVDHAGYRIDSDLPPQQQQDKNNILERERNEPSFSTGLLVTWRFHQRLGLQGGLFYSLASIHIDPQILFASQAPDGSVSYRYNTSAGYADITSKGTPAPAVGDSMTTTEAKLNLHSINLPLILQYELGNHKLKFSPSAGIAVSFMTKALLKTEMSDNSNHEKEFSERLQGTSNFYWSVMAGGTVSYETGKRCKVHVTPMFRYAVSPITNNNVVETFPYSFGVAAGVTMKF